MAKINAIGTQVQTAPAKKGGQGKKKGPCSIPCCLVPTNVPGPTPAQTILHPRKDVFVLKVAKVGSNGDRRCKMELELVTPKPAAVNNPPRVDTRETQFDPVPPPCFCCRPCKKKKNI